MKSGIEYRHMTLSVSVAPFILKKINFTFMILRAWTETLEGNLNWRNDAEEVIKQVNENNYLLGTIFLFPMGPTSTFSNKIFANNLWPSNLKYKFFMSNKLAKLPQFHFKDGLTHSKGTRHYVRQSV